MSSSTAVAGAVSHARHRHHSLHRQRAWALWASYAALGCFVVMFLVPPFYTLMTSLKYRRRSRPKLAVRGSCAIRRWRTSGT